MDQPVQIADPADSRRWIGRILVAVVLGEAIWGFLVSITNNLALPAMARVVGEDPQSPLYLGKGDFNVPPLFASIVELCLAGIVAIVVSSWSRKARVQMRTVRVAAAPSVASVVAPPAAPVVATRAESPASPATKPAIQANVSMPSAAPPQPPTPKPAQPVKPKKQKEVYYNIVGEPVETDEE